MRTHIDAIERRLRRLGGLSPERPAPYRMRFVSESGRNGRIEFLSDEQAEEAFAAWHAEPRWAGVLAGTVRQAHRLEYSLAHARRDPGSALGPIRRRVARRRAEHELRHARHLVWRAVHWTTVGEQEHIDAVLVLPSGRMLDWDIAAVGERARAEWEQGGVAWERGCVCVPATVLTPEIVEEALARSLMRRFSLTRGHWTLRERAFPALTCEVSWCRPRDPKARAAAEHAGIGAVADCVPHSPRARRRAARVAARFGRDWAPPEPDPASWAALPIEP